MLLQIPLDIADVQIEKFDASTKKSFVVTVTSELNGTTCQHCGKPIDKFYGYSKEIILRHLPILEKPVWIKIKPKRYQCPNCDNGPTTTQTCSWYDSKSPHTKAYEQWLLRDLINSTITDVSMKRGIGKAAVLDRGIGHVYIRPATPRLNGKVSNLRRIDADEFYKLLDGVVIDDSGLFAERLQESEASTTSTGRTAVLAGRRPMRNCVRRP